MSRIEGRSASRSVKDNNDQSTAVGSTEENEALLADRVNWIRHRHGQIVVERRRRFLEADAVAADIAASFGRIQLEANCHQLNLFPTCVHPPNAKS